MKHNIQKINTVSGDFFGYCAEYDDETKDIRMNSLINYKKELLECIIDSINEIEEKNKCD